MVVRNLDRIRRIWVGKSVLDLTAVFDAAWYLETYPDTVGADPLAHFTAIGWAEGRKPHPLFDTEWYLTTYPDVEASGQNPLAHYLETGWREGRRPNPIFHTQWYLDSNSDVREADIDPLTHYIRSGAEEGRRPNPVFDPVHYASACSNFRGTHKNALAHYLTSGWKLGGAPHPLFDPAWYREKASIPKTTEPLSHFLSALSPQSPHPLFDAKWYLEQNEDVASSGQNPLSHYIEAGKWERRSPHPLFDPVWYLEAYPDVEKAGIDPFEHFLKSGSDERRRPSAAFHTDWYAERYSKAAESRMNLLEHFVRFGERGGYKTSTFDANSEDKSLVASGGFPTKLVQAQKTSTKPAPPTKIAPNSGQLVSANVDELGQLQFPPFSRGDGRRLSSIRINRQHIWYDGPIVDEYLDGLQLDFGLPGIRSLLIIGHDFSLKTGVLRSLSHYLNALAHQGGIEVTSIEPVRGADATVVQHEIEVHDFVIVNSLPFFFDNPSAFSVLKKYAYGKCAVYLHETDFVFDRLERERPEDYAAFASHASDLVFLTVSAQQEEMLRRRFDANRLYRVAETSPIICHDEENSNTGRRLSERQTIIMAGTLQARKGVSLFSEVADMAVAAGLPWQFKWAGGEVGLSEGLYKSEAVDFLGHLDSAEMKALLDSADVFFLSSEDDPFPLACLEALQKQKRVVAYARTGTAEVLSEISGCAVYEQHSAEAAFLALRDAVRKPLDLFAVKNVNARFSLTGFVRAMNEAILSIHRPELGVQMPRWNSELRVAVVLHLFYHDLWNEIAGFLENTRHIHPDLYVTLTKDKSREELDLMRARILRRWPNATIIEVQNRGMDVGPFFEVVRCIKADEAHYDIVLKLHSKKSLTVSGAAHGEQWRRSLFSRLAGAPVTVQQALSIFGRHPKIGMIGPKGMRKQMTSNDLKAGGVVNRANMELMADRLGLSDRQQDFFVGTMFWARAPELFDAIYESGLRIDDFEVGHQPEHSRAHAMERLFANIVRDAGLDLHAHDPEAPKPISLFRDCRKGEDVYIIASGASAGFFPPSFFENKCVIGVNRVFERFACDYVVFKEFGGAEYERELLASGAVPITALFDSGNRRQGKMRDNKLVFRRPEYYFFDHLENARETVDLSVVDREADKLVVSYSTITTAMHLAAYMGARNIVLLGHDCGLLDGQANFAGYYRDMVVSPWQDINQYADWLTKIESQTVEVRDKIKDVYGANTVSLNPFVNFGLEGHAYSRRSDSRSSPARDSGRKERPVLLLGNGPSFAQMSVPKNTDDYLIARMNFFFLEREPFANGRVDHLFWSANNATFHDSLRHAATKGSYQIHQYNCPISYEDLRGANGPVSKDPFFSSSQFANHWAEIARYPKLAMLQMQRPLPTQGLQAMAGLAAAGYRKFAVAGIDFYKSTDARYAYSVPDDVAKGLGEVHLTPGYEKFAHTLSADLAFLKAILTQFPDITIDLLSDMEIFRKFLFENNFNFTTI